MMTAFWSLRIERPLWKISCAGSGSYGQTCSWHGTPAGTTSAGTNLTIGRPPTWRRMRHERRCGGCSLKVRLPKKVKEYMIPEYLLFNDYDHGDENLWVDISDF